jgi:hypothetical protein
LSGWKKKLKRRRLRVFLFILSRRLGVNNCFSIRSNQFCSRNHLKNTLLAWRSIASWRENPGNITLRREESKAKSGEFEPLYIFEMASNKSSEFKLQFAATAGA